MTFVKKKDTLYDLFGTMLGVVLISGTYRVIPAYKVSSRNKIIEITSNKSKLIMMGPDTAYCMVISACPDKETALTVANKVVESKLAACVSILPDVTSVYRWQGTIETNNEVLLLMKTTNEAFGDLQTLITGIHPYELPEIISVPITGGLHPYLNWITANVTPRNTP